MNPRIKISSLWFSKFLLLMASPVMLFPISVQAQVLEEIIVTAQRREQSLQEVPISLEAYGGDMLNKEGFRSIEDLANFLSNWLDIKRRDATLDRLYRYWVLGRDEGRREPRWSVIRNVLGWVD